MLSSSALINSFWLFAFIVFFILLLFFGWGGPFVLEALAFAKAFLSLRDRSGDSLPGRLGGVQYVHLYRDAAKADIMQLIMYLLGFFNEFRRPDRDSQVMVHYENIAPGND